MATANRPRSFLHGIVREAHMHGDWHDTVQTKPAPLDARRKPQRDGLQDWSWLSAASLIWPAGGLVAAALLLLAVAVYATRG